MNEDATPKGGLRAAIEALSRYDCTTGGMERRDNGEFVDRSEVLRLLDAAPPAAEPLTLFDAAQSNATRGEHYNAAAWEYVRIWVEGAARAAIGAKE